MAELLNQERISPKFLSGYVTYKSTPNPWLIFMTDKWLPGICSICLETAVKLLKLSQEGGFLLGGKKIPYMQGWINEKSCLDDAFFFPDPMFCGLGALLTSKNTFRQKPDSFLLYSNFFPIYYVVVVHNKSMISSVIYSLPFWVSFDGFHWKVPL